MGKSRFNIRGTKDFLVAAVFCGFLCIWAVRDAWFPTQKVLKKHPREIPVAFSVSGLLKEIPVRPGDEIRGRKMLLARLYDDEQHKAVAAAEAAFAEAKSAKDAAATEAALAGLEKARADLEARTVFNSDIKWVSPHGEDVLHGKVLRIAAEPPAPVEAGQTVLTVKPADTFYLFNQSLAVMTFLGTIASLIFHRIASR